MFTGLRDHDYIHCVKNSVIKPHVAPEEATLICLFASSDVTQWVHCIVGNVGTKEEESVE